MKIEIEHKNEEMGSEGVSGLQEVVSSVKKVLTVVLKFLCKR